MMVEGGRIDHACHANDAVGTIYDVIAFDEAIKTAYNFYLNYPNDTLIVVVGDHETGGMGLGFGSNYFLKMDGLKDVKVSVEDVLQKAYKGDRTSYYKYLEEKLGLKDFSKEEKAAIEKAMDAVDKKETVGGSYGGYNPVAIAVTHIVSERANLQWTTYAHSGTAIPMSAVGAGADNYNGYKDNTEVCNTLAEVMGVTLGLIK